MSKLAINKINRAATAWLKKHGWLNNAELHHSIIETPGKGNWHEVTGKWDEGATRNYFVLRDAISVDGAAIHKRNEKVLIRFFRAYEDLLKVME